VLLLGALDGALVGALVGALYKIGAAYTAGRVRSRPGCACQCENAQFQWEVGSRPCCVLSCVHVRASNCTFHNTDFELGCFFDPGGRMGRPRTDECEN
jgi:hypothetical protein